MVSSRLSTINEGTVNMALPNVTKQTLVSVKRYFDDREAHKKAAFGDLIEEMMEENPVLLKIILEYCEIHGTSRAEKKRISNCAFMIYKLMKSQDEANSWNEYLDQEWNPNEDKEDREADK